VYLLLRCITLNWLNCFDWCIAVNLLKSVTLSVLIPHRLSVFMRFFFWRFCKIAESDYLLCHVRPSVRLSDRMEQRGSDWSDFDEIWILFIFRKSVRGNSSFTKIWTGTSHEYVCTFMIISVWILYIMRNVLDESCKENQNAYFMFDNFFPKIGPFMR
jgi:hypothetical protein